MDRKSLIVVAASIVLLLVVYQVVDRVFPPPPRPIGTTSVAAGTNSIGGTNVSSTASTNLPPPPAVATASQAFAPPFIPTNWSSAKEETLELATEQGIYLFTSQGGGLKEVALKNYPETVDSRQKARSTNTLSTLNDQAPLPAFVALGAEVMQGDGIFTLEKLGDRTVRAEKSLTNGLNVVKDFTVGSNYVLTLTVKVENKSAATVTVPAHEWVIGTATPMNSHDPALNMGLDWHNGTKPQFISESYFANSSLTGCLPGNRQERRSEYRSGASNVFWAAVENQFFVLAFVPKEPALEIVSRQVALPKPTAAEIAADSKIVHAPHGFQTSIVLPAQTIPGGAAVERIFQVYAGPKEYKTLSRLADSVGKDLDSVMGFDRSIGGRFSAFFAKLLLLSMNGVHALLGIGYGWAIILITVIIKTLFWPLTQASTRSMKRMAALQPQIKELQVKYKDDPAKLSQKTMAFYKENKVNPMGGCLPMLLQFPVFLGFFVMIQSAIELRGAPFLWAWDLSRPDTVFHIPGLGFIPFLGVPELGFPINPLSILMAVTMWYQARMTPPSPGMDPAQQKMMKYMPLMFVVMLYNYSAALTLYWTTQNLLTLLQTKLTRSNEPAAPATPVKPVKKDR